MRRKIGKAIRKPIGTPIGKRISTPIKWKIARRVGDSRYTPVIPQRHR